MQNIGNGRASLQLIRTNLWLFNNKLCVRSLVNFKKMSFLYLMLIQRTNYDAPLNVEIKIIILSDSRKMYRKEGILTFATKTITGTKNIAYIT